MESDFQYVGVRHVNMPERRTGTLVNRPCHVYVRVDAAKVGPLAEKAAANNNKTATAGHGAIEVQVEPIFGWGD